MTKARTHNHLLKLHEVFDNKAFANSLKEFHLNLPAKAKYVDLGKKDFMGRSWFTPSSRIELSRKKLFRTKNL